MMNTTGHPLHKAGRALRLGAPILVTIACGTLVVWQFDASTLQHLPQGLAQLTLWQIALATALTALSFAAIARYDRIAHRHFDTGIAPKQAGVTGSIAVALSQTLGFGLVTGAFVRWRMLPALSTPQAAKLSAFVCLSFMAAMALMTAIACLVLPSPSWTTLPALATIAAFVTAILGTTCLPGLRTLRHKRLLPSLPAFGAILWWAALDLVAASAVLFVLIPASDLSFATLLPMFLLAYGVALISGAPGGVGPFELTLLALLPAHTSELLVGIVAYRGLYYALPAVMGGLALLAPFPPARAETGTQSSARPFNINALRHEPQVIIPASHTLCFVPSPSARLGANTLAAFHQQAVRSNKIACLYKCSARQAARARAARWQVLRIADEALLHPAAFTLDVPSRRGLRRKLRQAKKAGVRTVITRDLPRHAMAQIDAEWQDRKGNARGGSMQRFTPDTLGQDLFVLAFQGDTLIGFVSFETQSDLWTLELIRTGHTAPDGTVHALVCAAIAQAADDGIACLSLAAVPHAPQNLPLATRVLARMAIKHTGGAGLRQFKECFAPHWAPRYATSPRTGGLMVALGDIASEVHAPPPT